MLSAFTFHTAHEELSMLPQHYQSQQQDQTQTLFYSGLED